MHICIIEMQMIFITAIQICITEMHICIIEMQTCIIEMQMICITAMQICITELHICIIEMQICIIEMQICITGSNGRTAVNIHMLEKTTFAEKNHLLKKIHPLKIKIIC
jgi:hypothetical protein